MKIHEQEDSILEKSIICLIRVRGFPLRDILSLRALGDGLGQGRKKCRRAVAAVGVIFLSAMFSKEKFHKMLFL